MNGQRLNHTATLLSNGRVFIAGGDRLHQGRGTCETYDPVANTFTPAADFTAPRFAHATALLPNGKLLIAGGFSPVTSSDLASAEIYDVAANTATATGKRRDMIYPCGSEASGCSKCPRGGIVNFGCGKLRNGLTASGNEDSAIWKARCCRSQLMIDNRVSRCFLENLSSRCNCNCRLRLLCRIIIRCGNYMVRAWSIGGDVSNFANVERTIEYVIGKELASCTALLNAPCDGADCAS
jgi:hypothetical protein